VLARSGGQLEAEKRGRLGGRNDQGLARVELEPVVLQMVLDLR
jgi:hypothetical protein